MKIKHPFFIILISFFFSTNSFSQNRNAVWCFGDSTGIDFNNGAIPITTSLNTRGSCVSYCDTLGQLQLYAATGDNNDYTNMPFYTRVFNSSNLLIANGDSIRGIGWYKELILIPMPDVSMKYYLFSIGVTSGPGFSYSVVDMAQNGGLGEVIQKNVLLENFNVVDGLSAVKHGNGRDWWIVLRNASVNSNNQYVYLISPSGISNSMIQSVGSVNSINSGRYEFTPDGNRLIYINYTGLMELYDFDRCTGIISNPVTIQPTPTTAPYGWYWGCEFSANGRFLYLSTNHPTVSVLIQYDLWSPNPSGTCDTLEFSSIPQISNGFLKRGPDQKIYFSKAWECGAFPDCYPYPDSVYNYVNMNLSVINYPDSLGSACGYAPFSFYLGGKRTYYGLPNNPNYDLPALPGSPCDTLVSVSEPSIKNSTANLYVYYAADWEKAFINADKLKGKHYQLQMTDVLGKEVFIESGTLNSPYFTRDLDCSSFPSGIYLITFKTESERLVKKMQINWR